MENKWIPPISNMIQIVEGQPGTGLLKKIFFITMIIINMKDINENTISKNVDIDNEIVKELTIA